MFQFQEIGVTSEAQAKRRRPRPVVIPTYQTLSELRDLAIVQCRMRGRAIEIVYEGNKKPFVRDQKTGKRLKWSFTKPEAADLDAYISESPAIKNARLGLR